LCNAYSELNNQKEQELRFREEIEQIKQAQHRLAPMPEKFINAVSHLPECAGNALGIDRLVMLFCDAATIDEVMSFTVDDA
jgi:lysyl-tRNA synthetase class 2